MQFLIKRLGITSLFQIGSDKERVYFSSGLGLRLSAKLKLFDLKQNFSKKLILSNNVSTHYSIYISFFMIFLLPSSSFFSLFNFYVEFFVLGFAVREVT
jgi:hypothetical protein